MMAETDRAFVDLASYANKLLIVRGTKFAFPGMRKLRGVRITRTRASVSAKA